MFYMEWIIMIMLGIIVLLLFLVSYLIYIIFRSLNSLHDKLSNSRIEQDITNIKGNVRKALPRTSCIYTKDTQLTELIRVMEEIYTIKIDMQDIKTQIEKIEENVREGLHYNKGVKDKDNIDVYRDKEKGETA